MDSTSAVRRDGVRAADGTSGDVVAVLAVKHLTEAKSRLAASRRRADAGPHRALVLAMLLDTLDAITGAGIDRVVVVSPDELVLDAARSVGAIGVPEMSSSAVGADSLNLAFSQGAATARDRWPRITRVICVQADLPAARAESIRDVLGAAAGHVQSVLTDRAGTGTTMLIRAAHIAEPPRFGPDSAAAHRLAGAVELDADHLLWPDLRTDVDTETDLEAADALGVGRHTSATMSRHPRDTDAPPVGRHRRRADRARTPDRHAPVTKDAS
ncbi:2-phospho-L-lactate guanylyltransferase [Gordonia sp. OPL2]|uniref:2-phospho-L-lactate guanylyltransferase n=1 Tax=Gordonia sp. OPL2 TaxID=2486274 RepID=UPI001655D775|nr:2-phospho-L-lactate guanylyltransferase [Gordonia sp. OPL2]